MATTLPRPPRPSLSPPTSALPPLPTQKTRKSTSGARTVSQLNGPSPTSHLPQRPSLSRTASINSNSSALAQSNLHSVSTSNLQGLTPAPDSSRLGNPSSGKTVRKVISISSFPHPPKGGTRIASLPPSPLSGGLTVNSGVNGGIGDIAGSRRSSGDNNSPVTPGGSRLKRPTTLGGNGSSPNFSRNTPSLLNGTGDSKSILSGSGLRGTNGLLGLPSPPQSRSSSAQGSYSTSGTPDDFGDAGKGRGGADSTPLDSKRSSNGKEGKGNVIVSVRVRPDPSGRDVGGRGDNEWVVDGRKASIFHKPGGIDYGYDNVFTPKDDNQRVFETSAKRLVRRVMEGYHGTVFAYGMTGTGKTFSMQGTTGSPGVIPLAISDIFSYIRETPRREFLLRVSYLEIYNEKIHDLLAEPVAGGLGGPGAGQQDEIKLREDSKRGVYASPLKEEIVQSPTQLMRVIGRGDSNRRTAGTQFNARSSRSHAVVQIVVESRDRMPGTASFGDAPGKPGSGVTGGVRVSTLSLIDLAGSERAAESKERRAEGAHINRSLLTLGTVIARLSGDRDKDGNPTDKDGKHLPYRDSKLTRLLQPALSGNSLVSILCTIAIGSIGGVGPAMSHTGETLNTLKFASRAKNNIISHAKKAEESLGDANSKMMLERYRAEILELRSQLENKATAKVIEEEREREKEADNRHEEQMLEMQLARTALKERIEHLNRLILSSKSIGVNSSGTYSSLGMHNRTSGVSNGHVSSLSARSSGTQSTLQAGGPGALSRTFSNKSVSRLPNGTSGPGQGSEEEEDSIGENGDGTATLAAQVHALQADLIDKNRYISTLEKRLLQARRSSQSRTSMALSPPHKVSTIMTVEEGSVSVLLKEKDDEIAELRARLDDKERMVSALRSAARKRDIAEVCSTTATTTTNGSASVNRKQRSSSSGVVKSVAPGRARGKSVDEMSRMLDEMIQDRVESGQLVKGARGSLRFPTEKKREAVTGVIQGAENLKSPKLSSPRGSL